MFVLQGSGSRVLGVGCRLQEGFGLQGVGFRAEGVVLRCC